MTEPLKSSSQGCHSLKKAIQKHRMSFIGVAIFSAVVNILMLVGPLFMLQVYDRVLASHSTATLFALFIIVVFVYVVMGVLDHCRGRILARIGSGVQSALDETVFKIVMKQAESQTFRDQPASPLKELSSLRAGLSSSATGAIFDLPWTPFYIGVMFLFHPWLGWFSISSAILIFFLSVLNEFKTRKGQVQSSRQSAQADLQTEWVRSSIETIKGLGMSNRMATKWRQTRQRALKTNIKVADIGGLLSVITKTTRQLLQSAILALGALLVLNGDLTGGTMIAGSILLGRALAPVEQVVGQWQIFQQARNSWKSLNKLLEKYPAEPAKTELPRPKAKLIVNDLYVVPAGETSPVIRGITFAAEPGDAIGIIGPSSSGKTSLARALIGFWPPSSGEIRLDGAELNQYDDETLGSLIGYLPQDVKVYPGTVAENIARFNLDKSSEKIIAASQQAAAHDLILKLPNGYDTQITSSGGVLSGGQKQRIGLARAFYDDPVMLILDEPNSSLDEPGMQALNQAIKNARNSEKLVLVIAHRPSALTKCNKVLVIDKGKMVAFGDKDKVLNQVTRSGATS
ncbi:type I secretion system permease/ATPase [Vibrio caribbeanicus]|uniref:Type I secretion system ATPase n=1 Tax=Vibrio caribbeanicus ATCC BAA-2122 TaxID=796620 RepID=E3BKR1_9VIBR|nr:type I secretion system permease/ATPase [Vibrio caribbeanicus]EFP96255.1 type I secretion system ATPase [Vibrio caribbeanicus ATCC BAA-2122]